MFGAVVGFIASVFLVERYDEEHLPKAYTWPRTTDTILCIKPLQQTVVIFG